MINLSKEKLAKLLILIGSILLGGSGVQYTISYNFSYWGVFFISIGLASLIIGFFIFKEYIILFFTDHSNRFNFFSGISIIFFFSLTLFLGAIFTRHHLRWDFSQSGLYSLAPQSIELLRQLNEPVKIYVFIREAGEIKGLLDQYVYQNRMISYQLINPDRDPGLAKRFDIHSYGSAVLVKGDREERIKFPDEQAITNALIKLSRVIKKKIYFIIGHGERGITNISEEGISEFRNFLERQYYDVQSIILATQKAVPDDAAVLIVVGPKKSLSEHELILISNYLINGGKVVLMLDPDFLIDTKFSIWLKERGIQVEDNYIVDPQSKLFGTSPAWPITTDFSDHDITRSLKGMICFFPLARSITMINECPVGIVGTDLVRSSSAAWGEFNKCSLQDGQAVFDKGRDQKGPLTIAVLVTLSLAKEDVRYICKEIDKISYGYLLIIGNSSFLTNAYLNQSIIANNDLALNIVSYLADERELIAIRPKGSKYQPLLITLIQAKFIFWIPLLVIPMFFLILGIFVWKRRKRLI